MTGLDCNHDCGKCPAYSLGGTTHCMILNKILSTLEWNKLTAREQYNNTIKQGEMI